MTWDFCVAENADKKLDSEICSVVVVAVTFYLLLAFASIVVLLWALAAWCMGRFQQQALRGAFYKVVVVSCIFGGSCFQVTMFLCTNSGLFFDVSFHEFIKQRNGQDHIIATSVFAWAWVTLLAAKVFTLLQYVEIADASFTRRSQEQLHRRRLLALGSCTAVLVISGTLQTVFMAFWARPAANSVAEKPSFAWGWFAATFAVRAATELTICIAFGILLFWLRVRVKHLAKASQHVKTWRKRNIAIAVYLILCFLVRAVVSLLGADPSEDELIRQEIITGGTVGQALWLLFLEWIPSMLILSNILITERSRGKGRNYSSGSSASMGSNVKGGDDVQLANVSA